MEALSLPRLDRALAAKLDFFVFLVFLALVRCLAAPHRARRASRDKLKLFYTTMLVSATMHLALLPLLIMHGGLAVEDGLESSSAFHAAEQASSTRGSSIDAFVADADDGADDGVRFVHFSSPRRDGQSP